MATKSAVSNPQSAIDTSFAKCIQITKECAKNFHFAFSVLPPPRYRGICALYAFSRLADDISDDESNPEKARANTKKWRELFDRALAGDPSGHEILPAVAETMRSFDIPAEYMHELLNGTEMDSVQNRFETWKDTYLYCYRVASVIGMMTVHVFGFTGPKKTAMDLAERTGIAFQMTNILRDLSEDAGRDRIYLPQEDLRAHQVSEKELLASKKTPALLKLVQFEVERTKEYYKSGRELLPLIEDESRNALGSLVAIYQSLLVEIERRDYDVWSKRVSLSTAQKMSLAAGFAWKKFLGT